MTRKQKEPSPMVTVIVVTQDNVNDVDDILECLTTGTMKPTNVVIVDNDSKDGTYEKFCEKFNIEKIEVDGRIGFPPRVDAIFNEVSIIFVRTERGHIGDRINIAISHIIPKNTEFLGFMSPKSRYHKDKIKKCIELLQTNTNVAAVVSDYIENIPGMIERRRYLKSFHIINLIGQQEYDDNFFIRTTVLPKLPSGFHNIDMYNHAFLVELSEIGILYHLPEALHTRTSKLVESTNIREVIDMAVKRRNG
jgi:glycosyltransferase involved in cell wall biosynthesis